MLTKVSMRVTIKDPEKTDREVTDYVDCLLNTSNACSVIPTGMEGVLAVVMNSGQTHLVRAELDELLPPKKPLKRVK